MHQTGTHGDFLSAWTGGCILFSKRHGEGVKVGMSVSSNAAWFIPVRAQKNQTGMCYVEFGQVQLLLWYFVICCVIILAASTGDNQ